MNKDMEEWQKEQKIKNFWLPFGAEYSGTRYIVWNWYLAPMGIVPVFRAYTHKQAAKAYYKRVRSEAALFGGLARRLGVRKMTYLKILQGSKIFDPKTGQPVKMASKAGCSKISWARASQLFLEMA